MKRLKRYVTEIKQSLSGTTSQDRFNIILVCRDAICYIVRNSEKPGYLDLRKSFEDMEVLAENAASEGQHKKMDVTHSRAEKMKTIVSALEKYFASKGI
ncbi:MAG: hypothetical protein NTV63_04170 [Candidatus Woesearchaeota archaeon]|nr:hypothetical protein [Candidatus Woesearchaeota archaeon]